jgi:hypothetical protein
VRSANRIHVALAVMATVPVAALLSGCVTTQQVATRARLVDARIRASQAPLDVTSVNPEVRVAGVSLIRARHGTAVVAELHNLSTHPLTDLPVLVGIRTPTGRRISLNQAADTAYLDTHVVAIGSGETATWVFTSRRRLSVAGAPFVRVGTTQLPQSSGESLPQIEVRPATTATTIDGHALSLSVSNLSGIPQAGLPVYAVASRRGRVLGAGRATVGHLGTHGVGSVRLTLLGSQGSPSSAAVQLSALPTIFQ